MIHLYGPFVLMDQCLLGIQLLLGDGILLEEQLIALEVYLSIFEQGLIASHLSLCLSQLHLERTRVDFGQQSPAGDKIAFFEGDLH